MPSHDGSAVLRKRSGNEHVAHGMIAEPRVEASFRTSLSQPPTQSLRQRQTSMVVGITLIVAIGLLLWRTLSHPVAIDGSGCDSLSHGYTCRPEISQLWGPYSPYYSVDSEIADDLPPSCRVTLSQSLMRHGARWPTQTVRPRYINTIKRLQSSQSRFAGRYAFLNHYSYMLGHDNLTTFGRQQLQNAGYKFYQRYRALARRNVPFIRTTDVPRVIESAQMFSRGYHHARELDEDTLGGDDYPYPLVVLPSAETLNSSLHHSRCTRFESDPIKEIGSTAAATWAGVFIPPIRERFETDLPSVNLTNDDVLNLMELCAFETVNSPKGKVSPFCDLFTVNEWRQHDYHKSLKKFYGYGPGNPLGPTQGVGYTNELIARFTGKPVKDHTSTNSTLDHDFNTFPSGPQAPALFADFSHDNDLISILSAMGIFNATSMLPWKRIASEEELAGYSTSSAVPFAARVYFEKIVCSRQNAFVAQEIPLAEIDDEYIRIIVNDRVVPLPACGVDGYGRCTLSNWLESMSFAAHGGRWDECWE